MNLFMNDDDKKVKNSQQFVMCLRAQANAQRHAVVYRVELDDDVVPEIEDLVNSGKFEEALRKIKEYCKQVMIGIYGTTKSAAAKNWAMIPNKDLDPYK